VLPVSTQCLCARQVVQYFFGEQWFVKVCERFRTLNSLGSSMCNFAGFRRHTPSNMLVLS